MSETLEPLVLDLVEWIARSPRRHREVMEAWRTSCPRLTVWEEAVERGYVARRWIPGSGAMVMLTARGEKFLTDNGRRLPP
ncbi:MAG TPA: hypothetical protein VFQ27_13815 [Xanthobacteraceae bacterium]|nr:hypothetical protein [Xanthobacteraceae bacterium]